MTLYIVSHPLALGDGAVFSITCRTVKPCSKWLKNLRFFSKTKMYVQYVCMQVWCAVSSGYVHLALMWNVSVCSNVIYVHVCTKANCV